MNTIHVSAAMVTLRDLWDGPCRPELAHVHALEEQLCARAVVLISPGFRSRELSSTIHSIGSLPFNSAVAGAVDALVAAALPQLPGFNPQALANTAGALATLGHSHPTFMDALVTAALPQLPGFNPQNLANTAWALATLGHSCSAFIYALVAAALPQLPGFKPQELANTAWALATLGHSCPTFMDALVAVALPQLPGFKPQELANTA